MIRNIVVINDFEYIQGGASKVAIETANALADSDLNVFFFSGVATINNSVFSSKVKRICTNQFESLLDVNIIRGAINGVYNFRAKKEEAE